MNTKTKNTIIRIGLLLLNVLLIGTIAFSLRNKQNGKKPAEQAKKENTVAQNPGIKRVSRKKTEGAQLSGLTIKTTSDVSEATEQKLADGSRVNVLRDGYGGTTVTRHFGGHRRLRMVVVQTASNEQQRIFVYGRNGKVTGVPDDMAKKILVASADDIANAAKIYIGTSEKEAKRIRLESVRKDIAYEREQQRNEMIAKQQASRPVTEQEGSNLRPNEVEQED
jgi:hypothetical protein